MAGSSLIVWQRIAILALGLWCCGFSAAAACPFCGSPAPTVAARRALADWSGWGEVLARDAERVTVEVRQTWQGSAQGPRLDLPVKATAAQPGALVLILGTRPAEASPPRAIEWEIETLNELRLAYLVRAPDPNRPAAERLTYYAPFLEHDDSWLAADAFGEFAAAPYAAVEAVAPRFDLPRLARWMDDPNVRAERKGLYALLLALAGRERDRARTAAVLERTLLSEASDFRAGFSGVVAGYLLCAGPRGLQTVSREFLDVSEPREGDLRHVWSALRFYHDEVAESGPAVELAGRRLLGRPTMAAEVIGDLARWHAVAALADVVRLYPRNDYPQPATGRAVVAYLLAVDSPEGQASLDRLRRSDPTGVEAALRYWSERPSER